MPFDSITRGGGLSRYGGGLTLCARCHAPRTKKIANHACRDSNAVCAGSLWNSHASAANGLTATTTATSELTSFHHILKYEGSIPLRLPLSTKT